MNMNKEMRSTEIESYKKAKLLKKPGKKLLDLLNLKGDEEILINLRIFPFKSICKDNVWERYAKCLVLTTKRIFIINSGWFINDVISFDEITDVIATRKYVFSSRKPVISIKSVNNLYDVFFNTIFPFPYREKIAGIVDCIKNRNPNVNVNIDIKDDDPIEVLFKALFNEIKFK